MEKKKREKICFITKDLLGLQVVEGARVVKEKEQHFPIHLRCSPLILREKEGIRRLTSLNTATIKREKRHTSNGNFESFLLLIEFCSRVY